MITVLRMSLFVLSRTNLIVSNNVSPFPTHMTVFPAYGLTDASPVLGVFGGVRIRADGKIAADPD